MVPDRMKGREPPTAATGAENNRRPDAPPEVGSERRRRRPNSWGFLEFDIDQGSWPRLPTRRRAQPSVKECDSTKGASNGKSGYDEVF